VGGGGWGGGGGGGGGWGGGGGLGFFGVFCGGGGGYFWVGCLWGVSVVFKWFFLGGGGFGFFCVGFGWRGAEGWVFLRGLRCCVWWGVGRGCFWGVDVFRRVGGWRVGVGLWGGWGGPYAFLYIHSLPLLLKAMHMPGRGEKKIGQKRGKRRRHLAGLLKAKHEKRRALIGPTHTRGADDCAGEPKRGMRKWVELKVNGKKPGKRNKGVAGRESSPGKQTVEIGYAPNLEKREAQTKRAQTEADARPPKREGTRRKPLSSGPHPCRNGGRKEKRESPGEGRERKGNVGHDVPGVPNTEENTLPQGLTRPRGHCAFLSKQRKKGNRGMSSRDQ